MKLPPFDLHEPASLDEATTLATTFAGDCNFIAGGTDLLQNYKNQLNVPKHVISLLRVPGLREISTTRIGALARLSEVEESPLLQRSLPSIPDCVTHIATPLVRQSATVGGNLLADNRCFFFNQSFFWRESKGFCLKADGDKCLVVPAEDRCYATFSSDLGGLVVALDGMIHLHGPKGPRQLPARQFYHGPDGINRLDVLPGEVLTGVELPKDATTLRAKYRKLRIRDSFDYPEMGLAAVLRLGADQEILHLRIVVNAVEMQPRRMDEVTSSVIGSRLTDTVIEDLAGRCMELSRPVRNTHLPPTYRRKMVRVYVREVLRDLRDGAVHERRAA